MDIKSIYNSYEPERRQMALRCEYYKGLHIPPELKERRYLDKRPKAQARSNFASYTASMYSGFLTSNRITYTSSYPEENTKSLDNFDVLYDNLGLSAQDAETVANCIVFGTSIEVHGVRDGEIVIQSHCPVNWVPVCDEGGNIRYAINKVCLEPHTIYNGEFLSKKLVLYYVYSDTTIDIYREPQDGRKKELEQVESVPHPYGTIPVIFHRINKDSESFFDESFLALLDNYIIVASAMIDDVRYTADSFLKLMGVDYNDLMKQDSEGVNTFTKFKNVGILPLEGEASAEFLTRTIDTDKFRFALTTIRADIFRNVSLPDIMDKMNGETAMNSISGVALNQMYQSMVFRAGQFRDYLRLGLKQRIGLVNRIYDILGMPPLTNVAINIKLNLPTNDIELMQNIKQMDGLLSKRDQLKLLPFVDNPDLAIWNYEQEQAKLQAPVEAQATAPALGAQSMDGKEQLDFTL